MMKMKGAIVGAALLSVAVIVLVGGAAFAAAPNIADNAWDESNLSKLRSFGKDEVFDFLVQTKDDVNDEAIELYLGDDSRCIEGFTWADLAGDHRYDLVVIFEPEGTSLTNIVAIYRRSSSGKIGVQVIDGDGIGINGNRGLETPKLIQDLDGDGKYELVVPQEWGSTRATSAVISLKVYRLSNGSYVEASRDFPKFYDTQVLPGLEDEINQAKHEPLRNGPAPPELTTPQQINEWRHQPERKLAFLEMNRDKILRLLGRDPKAGEKEAREWVKSGDWELIGDAIGVFEDMGDHEGDIRAAELAQKRAPID